MRSRPFLILAAIVLVGGCGSGGDDMSSGDSHDPSLPGVYSGTFPCRNCPGIETTLWLRSDKRFFLRQHYPGDADSQEAISYNLGRWSLIADGRVLDLHGAGPLRSFTRRDRDTLIMRGNSEFEHRLSRESATPDFTSTIAMSGMMTMTGDNASFKECLTGLVAPVANNRELARFQRQYRRIDARGAPVFVEFKGRFSWSRDSSLNSYAIERFLSIKENQSC